jgi:hypothetical protein
VDPRPDSSKTGLVRRRGEAWETAHGRWAKSFRPSGDRDIVTEVSSEDSLAPRKRWHAPRSTPDAGVTISGTQSACAMVSGLPSVSANGIAVIGRQKLQKYLASQHAIAPSAIARFSSAKSRAFFDKLRCR